MPHPYSYLLTWPLPLPPLPCPPLSARGAPSSELTSSLPCSKLLVVTPSPCLVMGFRGLVTPGLQPLPPSCRECPTWPRSLMPLCHPCCYLCLESPSQVLCNEPPWELLSDSCFALLQALLHPPAFSPVALLRRRLCLASTCWFAATSLAMVLDLPLLLPCIYHAHVTDEKTGT